MDHSSNLVRFLRCLEGWTIPPRPARVLKTFLVNRRNISIPQHPDPVLARNIDLKHRHVNRRCFVLGNGPSNSSLDLSPLRDEITISCNHFYKYSRNAGWSPTYYCTGDPIASWIQSEKLSLEAFADYWNNIVSLTSCSAYLAHISCKSYLDSILSSLNPPLFYFNASETLSLSSGKLDKIDFVSGRHTPVYLTPMLGINLAIYMGCNPIYLVGCDNNYLIEYLNGKQSVEHFYSEDSLFAESLVMPMSKMLYDTYLTVYGFEVISEYCGNFDIAISDLTPNGFLVCFQKDDFRRILACD